MWQPRSRAIWAFERPWAAAMTMRARRTTCCSLRRRLMSWSSASCSLTLRTIAVACLGMDDFFPSPVSSYSIIGVSLPPCSSKTQRSARMRKNPCESEKWSSAYGRNPPFFESRFSCTLAGKRSKTPFSESPSYTWFIHVSFACISTSSTKSCNTLFRGMFRFRHTNALSR